ncbi:TlpA family protein disulfide reductase [bacterium]|nr:TlpA family protein disulfide reductase [bacterium]
MKKLLTILLLVLVVASMATKAPRFKLDDVNGNEVKLSSYIGDYVILIDFWSTGCAPCVAVMPHMQEMYEEYKDDGFIIFGISEDLPRNTSAVKAKARELGVKYPILIDKSAAVLTAYHGAEVGIPYIVVIDLDGNIFKTISRIQPGDEDKIEAIVRDALGK